jgi:hypothetical protein
MPPQLTVTYRIFLDSAEIRAMLEAFPDALHTLFSTGVPIDFLGTGRYTVAATLAIVDIPSRGRMIRFGEGTMPSNFCIVPRTGEVVDLSCVPDHEFVNSSLTQFVRVVKAVTGRFPFYDTSDDLDERNRVGDELAAMIEEIDPPAMEIDLFWSTFVDDIRIGDFPTEDVLARNRRNHGSE